MTTVTVALVGKRAGAFATGIASSPNTRIIAVVEPDDQARAQLADASGTDASGQFSDYEQMLDCVKPAAVVLGTPMHLHVPQAVRALDAGTSVLSEVTAGVTLEQCTQLVTAVRRAQHTSGATYMMAENYCYRKDVVLVRAMARAGLFGAGYFAEGEYLHDVKRLHHAPDGSGQLTWRAMWQVGKRGCTYGTHSLGPALEFFGPQARVTSVSCIGTGMHTDPHHPHDDTCLMLCQLNTGGLIKVRVDMISNRPEMGAFYSLQGTKGVFEGQRGGGCAPRLWLDESGHDPAEPSSEKREWRSLWDYEQHLPDFWRNPSEAALRAGHGGGDYFIVQDFLNALRTGTPPPIDVHRALDYTLPGLLSERSIVHGGTPISVPDSRTWDTLAPTTSGDLSSATPLSVGASA